MVWGGAVTLGKHTGPQESLGFLAPPKGGSVNCRASRRSLFLSRVWLRWLLPIGAFAILTLISLLVITRKEPALSKFLFSNATSYYLKDGSSIATSLSEQSFQSYQRLKDFLFPPAHEKYLLLSPPKKPLKTLEENLKPLPAVGHDLSHDYLQSYRGLDQVQCLITFPKIFHELNRSLHFYEGRKVSSYQLDQAMKVGHARVLIYDNQVFVKEYKGGPGKRTEASLNSIQEAVLTSPEPLPNVEFVLNTHDAPGSSDEIHPLWVLDRTDQQLAVWLMPDFGFNSWPEPKVGSMGEVRMKSRKVDSTLTWKTKISKAFWRGALLIKLRQDLVDVGHGKPWSDISGLAWNKLDGKLKRPEDHCQYKFLIHVEGFAYSGRLKYLQMCRSVIITHQLKYTQHFHHLFNSDLESPHQNIVVLPQPGFQGLDEMMTRLISNDSFSERIANNSVEFFGHYLSPASVNCYWRQLFRDWHKIQGFEPVYDRDLTSMESFNLMHKTHWDPY